MSGPGPGPELGPELELGSESVPGPGLLLQCESDLFITVLIDQCIISAFFKCNDSVCLSGFCDSVRITGISRRFFADYQDYRHFVHFIGF